MAKRKTQAGEWDAAAADAVPGRLPHDGREPIRLVWRKIDELIPYAGNAKLHPQEQVDRLVDSFNEFGRIVPAGIDSQGNLIYGHGRILAARQRGDTEFPCIEIEGLSELQRRAFVHADNLLAQSPMDETVLRGEMEALAAAGFDVQITGYDPNGLRLGEEGKPTPEISEDDFDEELPANPRTKRGQLWQLGEHRLLCGDSASSADVQTCVGGGQLADMVFTDPPYGVSIGDKNKALDEVGGKSGMCKKNIVNDTLTAEQLAPIYKAAFRNMREACTDDAVYFVTSPPGGDLGLMMMMMADAGLPVRHRLCWRKNAPTFSIGRLDYDYQHEAILYTWTKSHHNFRRGQFRSTVWDVPKPRANRLHPTMKPIALVASAILDGTEPGMVVLDPFGGSGSTLIACEQTGRRCRMIEIDPHYCDVIIDRWEQFTGQKAVLLDG